MNYVQQIKEIITGAYEFTDKDKTIYKLKLLGRV